MAAPDLGTIHALCVLQLAAHRSGCTIRLYEPSSALRELIVLVGLEDALLDVTAPADGREGDHAQ
jgi:ABC-type transporter Mla MlaB component